MTVRALRGDTVRRDTVRRDTLRWLRIAALIVIALVAVRTATVPRAITSIAPETAAYADHGVRIAADGVTGADDVVEARPVRRARQLMAGALAQVAVLVGLAMMTAATVSHRRSPLVAPPPASRAVPVLGGRGPPVLQH